MVDIVSKEVRSRMMSGIRSKNTKPEIMLRKGLHSSGFRFRIHDPKLLGKPDLVFPKYNSVIFVHGCFWHRHLCSLFKWPTSRSEFWRNKLNRNHDVDAQNIRELLDAGWRVGVVWECSLMGVARLGEIEVVARCSEWLRGNTIFIELSGGQS